MPHCSLLCPRQIFYLQMAVVAEWLRRLTRNQIPSGSAGSNPADCEEKYFFLITLAF